MQIVELHYREVPDPDFQAVRDRARELLGTRIELAPSGGEKAQLFVHADFVTQFKDKAAPALTSVLRGGERSEPARYEESVQQSWATQDAAGLIAQSSAAMLVTEMMCDPLEPDQRVSNFHGVLQAMVELTAPVAMVFMHSQQVIDPEDYLRSCDRPPIFRMGSLNVRSYNISNGEVEGEQLMDTLGLDAIGLHDLQCHFAGLDGNDVANVLYNTGLYIFENGPVIESGQTVQGIEEGSMWLCQFEQSPIKPERDVLDLNPGPPYAAGRRDA